MPLPLGHAAIGLATYELSTNRSAFKNGYRLAIITFLANLPDIDVVIGLFLRSNGNAFHRGPTHSLLFALVMGLVVWAINKRWLKIPEISFFYAFLIILSHVCADAWLTQSRVSFFWPFEIHWSSGHASIADVVQMVVFESIRDGWIVIACGLILLLRRGFFKSRRSAMQLFKLPQPVVGFLGVLPRRNRRE
jgi:membrane-bound metal-dependent hydrolase YbcI (DUF457 family)